MTRSTRLVLFLMMLCMGLSLPCSGFSEAQEKKGVEAKDSSIVIKSNSLEINDEQKTVSFVGNVDAVRDDFRIRSQKMTVYYTSPSAKVITDRKGAKIEKIVATGDVKITREEGGLATSEQAVYYQMEEKVVLTGNPVVKMGGDFVEGNRVILFLKEKRSIVEGSESNKVRAVLSPRGEKR